MPNSFNCIQFSFLGLPIISYFPFSIFFQELLFLALFQLKKQNFRNECAAPLPHPCLINSAALPALSKPTPHLDWFPAQNGTFGNFDMRQAIHFCKHRDTWWPHDRHTDISRPGRWYGGPEHSKDLCMRDMLRIDGGRGGVGREISCVGGRPV